MRDHRKLQAFQLADTLATLVYCATRGFPPEEAFGVSSQMRRAAVSAAANIVEGCARRSDWEYNRFLDISFGSIREVGYFIELAARLNYVTPGRAIELQTAQGRAAAALAALLRIRTSNR